MDVHSARLWHFYFAGGFMAQYDGSIRINTKITTKEASAQLMTLENRIVKTSDKIASLRHKIDSLKDAKIPTTEYQEISAQISKAEIEFNKLLEKQEQMQREGKDNGVAWDRLNQKIEEVGNTIRYAKGELQDLTDTGKAVTLGSDTEEFEKLSQQLQYAENDLAALNQRHNEMLAKQKKGADGYKKLGNTAKQSFDKINKSAKKSNGLLGTMATRFKGLALSLLIFNQISKVFRALAQGMKEGFKNLYNEVEGFKNVVDGLKASSLTLKNSFAAAFRPLVEMAIPYIQKAVEWLTVLMDKLSQFIAITMGQKTYTKAIKQTTAALKDQNKAQNRQLSSLDKLNNLTSDKDGGTDGGTGDMFEEISLDNNLPSTFEKITEYAQELKDIFSQGFWDGLGDWEYRWESIKESVGSIKDNLIEIWTDPEVTAAANGYNDSIAYMLGSLAGSAASIGLTIITNLVGGISKYLKQNKKRIKEYIVSMFDIGAEINYLIAEFANSFAYIFEAFSSESGQQLTANIIGIFTDAFMGVTELIGKLARDILNIFIQPFVENKEEFKIALEGFLSVLSEVTGTIKEGIDETFDKLNEVYDEHFKPFFDSIAEGLSDTVGKFMEFWNGQVQPILDEWAAKFDEVWKAHIQPALDKFINLLGKVADFLKVVWENILKPLIDWIIKNILPVILPIIKGIGKAFMTLFGTIGDIVGGIIDIFGGIIDFLTGVFSGDWDKAWNGIVDVFKGIFNLIPTIIEGILNTAIDIINGLIGGINKITDAVGIPAIPEIKEVSIPRLATGTVVPPNREFLAVLGDNKREPEVVSPLSTIEQAVENVLRRNGGAGNDKEINLHLTVECEGYQLIHVLQKLNKEYAKQNSGKSIFA